MRRLADRIIKRIADDFIKDALRPNFPDVSSYDFDLILADAKRDAEIMLTKRLEEVADAARAEQ